MFVQTEEYTNLTDQRRCRVCPSKSAERQEFQPETVFCVCMAKRFATLSSVTQCILLSADSISCAVQQYRRWKYWCTTSSSDKDRQQTFSQETFSYWSLGLFSCRNTWRQRWHRSDSLCCSLCHVHWPLQRNNFCTMMKSVTASVYGRQRHATEWSDPASATTFVRWWRLGRLRSKCR